MSTSDSVAARALVDFLNHGLLPFIGRSNEAEQVFRFWEGTFEAQGLRAALLVGEAGVGKSRVVEEAIRRINEAGGALLHAKLYPGAATALPPLIARALRAARPLQQGALPSNDDGLTAVIGALQRMARLRPTMLIVEDIHLLNEDSLGDFATLLHALADEAISILAVARPVDFVPRGVLERYLVGEIKVGGLTEDDLHELWGRLFGEEADPAAITTLHSVTNGNPLAIRSALRGAISAGTIDQSPNGGGWVVTAPSETYQAVLERGVQVLAEGMAAHLMPEERRAAEQLAALGEIFSREGAGVMIDDAERMLELLTFKGILTVAATAPAPLAGKIDGSSPASSYPLLAFTHSLVHRRFIQQADIDLRRVVDVIAADAPLYSTLPFQTLTESDPVPALPARRIYDVIMRVVALAFDLDESPDWELALPLVEGGFDLLRQIDCSSVSAEDIHYLEARLISCKLSLMRRTQHTPEFRELVHRFMEHTKEANTAVEARLRMMALSHIYRFSARWNREPLPSIWDEAHELLDRFPELLTTRPYLTFLRDVALDARREGDIPTSRKVEERLNAILASPADDERMRQVARKLVAPFFLMIFTSEEELQRRKEMLRELERMPDELNSLYLAKMQFLMLIGEMERAIQVCEAGVARMRERGLDRSWVHGALIQIFCETALGLDFDGARAKLMWLREEASDPARPRLCESSGLLFSEMAFHRDAPEELEKILTLFPESLERYPADLAFLRGREKGEPDIISTVARHRADGTTPLMAVLAHIDDDLPTLRDAFKRSFAMPILKTSDFLGIYALLELLCALRDDPRYDGLSEELQADATQLVTRGLTWLHERKLSPLMERLLNRYGNCLDPKELAEWRRRRDATTKSLQSANEQRDAKLRLSMLGVVEITTPRSEKIRPRGARVRALLALMVADRMLERPLEHREFCRLASDNQDDSEHARKVVNISVFRLRELLGQEAILTDAETPRLNLEKVQVDLLDADALLDEVEEAMGKGSLMRAHTALVKTFEITRGEVPFPSLYDGFFEAAREDFECRLRDAALDVARGLIYEGDLTNAEEILRRAHTTMPEDRELAELLREALHRLGKRAEAELVSVDGE